MAEERAVTVVAYHWDGGAWINGFDPDFERDLAALVEQYGWPDRVTRSSLNDDGDLVPV